MTGWHLIAGYSLIAGVYLVVSIVIQVVVSLGRPASNGHLDVNIQFSRFGRWFVASAILLGPIVIGYAEKSTIYYDKTDRTINMLAMYMVIALAWNLKLQLQINKIESSNKN